MKLRKRWRIWLSRVSSPRRARAHLYRLIALAVESHQPIHITGKRTSAVFLSSKDWRAIQETLYLLSVPGMRKSIRNGMAVPLGKSSKAIKW